MPPAPPGGSVGMGPSGGWASSGARSGMGNRSSRIPGAARAKPNPPDSHGDSFRRAFDNNRGNETHSVRPRQGPEANHLSSSSQRESSLPPKPPLPATYQAWSGNQSNRIGRDRTYQGRFSGRPEGSVDSYVPNYSGMGERFRERGGGSPSPNRDFHQANRRDIYRDHTRKRSRSPVVREGGRSTERGIYRR